MYERLLRLVPIPINEKADLPDGMKGLYLKTTTGEAILLSCLIDTQNEKTCILGEEVGHYYTSVGNILDQKSLQNRKQELRARTWAYKELFHLEKIIQAHKIGVRNKHELAIFMEITEDFLESALKRYQEIYGLFFIFDVQHTICFEPLGVLEMFDFI
ncbi:ImmA/IrrE family metallo-endopeptidase [Paenibacillus eucommiae]|uniref:IrrE N-terminal-like domain-containing protein n=1 Tax=Paenibacillus eucommiae TaxID=1355755 RepID=A0ABS4IYB7_9BACL|nr:ImmA/IrrE family metallo-endopeptidase [Paenibacillus eucommiae]MBP1992518.1 hypothetical protein [Paenibacillus eucommiae]